MYTVPHFLQLLLDTFSFDRVPPKVTVALTPLIAKWW